MNRSPATAPALGVAAPRLPGSEIILTPEALGFVERLAQAFTGRIEDLLEQRRRRQAAFDAGERPDFLPSTAAIRAAEWSVPPPPPDLRDRRVEITGPIDRKMIINALNSGASVFMADFEDSNAPTWANVLSGQINLRDAVRRTIRYRDEVRDRTYTLDASTATLMVRPRGWHLLERHLLREGRPIPAALADFGLYFFHNARALVERGTGPFLFLP
jgi:malate synthase